MKNKSKTCIVFILFLLQACSLFKPSAEPQQIKIHLKKSEYIGPRSEINTFDNYCRGDVGSISLGFTKGEQDLIIDKTREIGFFHLSEVDTTQYEEGNTTELLELVTNSRSISLKIRLGNEERIIKFDEYRVFKNKDDKKKFIELCDLILEIAYSRPEVKKLDAKWYM